MDFKINGTSPLSQPCFGGKVNVFVFLFTYIQCVVYRLQCKRKRHDPTAPSSARARREPRFHNFFLRVGPATIALLFSYLGPRYEIPNSPCVFNVLKFMALLPPVKTAAKIHTPYAVMHIFSCDVRLEIKLWLTGDIQRLGYASARPCNGRVWNVRC